MCQGTDARQRYSFVHPFVKVLAACVLVHCVIEGKCPELDVEFHQICLIVKHPFLNLIETNNTTGVPWYSLVTVESRDTRAHVQSAGS